MISPIIVERLKKNDKSLTSISIFVSSLQELHQLHSLLQKNTYITHITLTYKHIIHSQTPSSTKNNIENTVISIKNLIEHNRKSRDTPSAITTQQKSILLQKKPTMSFFSPQLRADLNASAAVALSQPWIMPSTTKPLTEDDVKFLRSKSVADLVVFPQSSGDSIVKKFIINVLTSAITKLTTDFIVGLLVPNDSSHELIEKNDISSNQHEILLNHTGEEGTTKTAKKIYKKSIKVLSADNDNNFIRQLEEHGASESGETPSRTPFDFSSLEVTKKLGKKQITRLTQKQLFGLLEERLKNLPDTIDISQQDADKYAKVITNGFKNALKAGVLIDKISKDPSRENILDISLDYVKNKLIKQFTELAEQQLLKSGTILGLKIATNLNPILMVIEGVFTSYEIDANHDADKPYLSDQPSIFFNSMSNLPKIDATDIGPTIRPQPNNNFYDKNTVLETSKDNQNSYPVIVCTIM